jgi:hypothetical protein
MISIICIPGSVVLGLDMKELAKFSEDEMHAGNRMQVLGEAAVLKFF